MEKWDKCKLSFDEEMLAGRICYSGLDLSSTTDITAFVLVFPPTDEDEHYYDRSAEPETKYFYKLTAIDAAENESAQSEAVSAILEKDTEAPKIVSVSPEDGGTVSTAQKTISVLVSDNVKLSSVTIAYRLSDDADYKVFSKANSIDNYYIVAEGTLPKAALSGDRVQIQSLCS